MTASDVSVVDLTTVDIDLKGFRFGFTSGDYGYLVPYHNGAAFGKLVRISLSDFSAGGVTVVDLTTVDRMSPSGATNSRQCATT